MRSNTVVTVMAVAVVLLATSTAQVSAQSLREQFMTAYQQQQQAIVGQAKIMANNVWDLVCTDDCTFTVPSHQANSSVDPNVGFNTQTFTDPQPYLDLIASIGNVGEQLMQSIVVDADDDDMFNNAMFASIMSTDFSNLQEAYQNFYQGLASSWQSGGALVNATLQGGSGFGFGFQIDCNSTVLFTLGGGFGTGFNGKYGQMQAGGGGGAGLQAYDSMGNTIMTTGGGGGGGLDMVGQAIWEPSWGTSTDPGQVIDRNLWQKLSQTANQCYNQGGLILRAAGGGGGGLYAGSMQPSNDDLDDDPTTPTQAMAYGGGWGYSFTHAAPSGSGTATDPVTGSALGRAATQCHTQCSAIPSGSDGQTFYDCFCPCLKTAFLQIPGQSWANHMVCYIPAP